MDRFTGMAVFAKVVESSRFAAAARHFHLSPALVSRHVQALEEELGERGSARAVRHAQPPGQMALLVEPTSIQRATPRNKRSFKVSSLEYGTTRSQEFW